MKDEQKNKNTFILNYINFKYNQLFTIFLKIIIIYFAKVAISWFKLMPNILGHLPTQ